MAQWDAAKTEKKDAEKTAKEIEKKKKEEKKKEEEMVIGSIQCSPRTQPVNSDWRLFSCQSPEDLELKEKLGLLVERSKDADSAVAKAALESMRSVPMSLHLGNSIRSCV